MAFIQTQFSGDTVTLYILDYFDIRINSFHQLSKTFKIVHVEIILKRAVKEMAHGILSYMYLLTLCFKHWTNTNWKNTYTNYNCMLKYLLIHINETFNLDCKIILLCKTNQTDCDNLPICFDIIEKSTAVFMFIPILITVYMLSFV